MISEVKPSAITIPSTSSRSWTVLVIEVCDTVVVLVAFGASHGLSLVVYLAVVASVSAGLLYRAWRAGVRFDDHGLTTSYVFGSYRFGWSEVSCFRDGCCTAGIGPHRGKVWALEVVLRDGGAVKVKATAREVRKSAAPEVLTAISQAAERYGIQEALTGRMPTDKADA